MSLLAWLSVCLIISAGGVWSVCAAAKRADHALADPSRVRGKASWYGESYRGKTMANGQPFDPEAMTCAAMCWPLGTLLRVHGVENGKTVVVEVTDRGPAAWTGCLVDLSSRAFRRICDPRRGHVAVWVEVLR
jgi:rare lipoprotein A